MKKLIGIAFITLCFAFNSVAHAQEDSKVKKTTKKVAHKTEEGAKKVGNKTAEVASKSKARITDEVYKDKVGPNGETVYIDNHSKYYWVDKKGHRHYASGSELKAKE